ncbi:MAG: glycosyltransferase [Anaerolineales bacterium]|jgi:glycosyltransferase involved in cell wall biosynthesis|nr:glycosyltransferase [Anaerolineales bacterium]GER80053.1 glycosyltransferase family 2 protein [Candidatus Denitrolinea symbiosum]
MFLITSQDGYGEIVKPFLVSVNIPVYNAADYVEQAVESALALPQTAEVILVEDCSTDNSWKVCQALAAKYGKVHLYRHPDGRNHGCSASRSLAAEKSTCEYISFLDADDFYLPGRFDTAEQLFGADPELEGVYEAIGAYVEDEVGLQRWKDAGREGFTLHTMTEYVQPRELFSTLIAGKTGSFSIVGLVVKRNVFEKVGYFDETLSLHMDEIFMFKLAALAKLLPGQLDKPVALWRVHDHNRISAYRSKSLIYKMKLKWWYALWKSSRGQLNSGDQQLVLSMLIKHGMSFQRFGKEPGRGYRLGKLLLWIMLLMDCPKLFFEIAYWRQLDF